METWWEHGGKHGDCMDFLKKDIYIYICHICLVFLARPYDMFDVEVLVRWKALLDDFFSESGPFGRRVVVGIQFHTLDTEYLQ